jgi:hypothetical protein
VNTTASTTSNDIPHKFFHDPLMIDMISPPLALVRLTDTGEIPEAFTPFPLVNVSDTQHAA